MAQREVLHHRTAEVAADAARPGRGRAASWTSAYRSRLWRRRRGSRRDRRSLSPKPRRSGHDHLEARPRPAARSPARRCASSRASRARRPAARRPRPRGRTPGGSPGRRDVGGEPSRVDVGSTTAVDRTAFVRLRCRALGTLRAMTPEEFRKQGHALIDWIADYLEGIERHPVAARCEPGGCGRSCPAHPPTEPEPFDDVLADLDRVIVPGLTHWQHPSFFAYFPANSSYPAILGELAAAGLGVQRHDLGHQPGLHRGRDADDGLDGRAARPARPVPSTGGTGGGVIQGTASGGDAVRHPGGSLSGPPAGAGNRRRATRRPTSSPTPPSQAHSSHREGPADRRHRQRQPPRRRPRRHVAMRPDALAAAIAEDRAAGRQPFFVCATAGTTSTDGVRSRAGHRRRSASREGLWLHVDAAMSGIAALCPELRWVNDGLDRVDSYCTNPHKWMGVNFDCDLFWVADRAALLARAVDPARVPPHRGRRGRRRDRLPRLADPPGPTVPCAEAVVHAALRRGRRRPGHDPRSRGAGRRSWPAGWRPTTGSRSSRPIR